MVKFVIHVATFDPSSEQAEPSEEMPSEPGSVSIVLGFDHGVRVAVPLETLTAAVRAYRKQRMATREELKALRQKAMGVIGEQRQANADMYNRVIVAGDEVVKARAEAEAAQMGALTTEIADLNEMRDEMAEFAQAASPTTGASAGTPSSPTSAPAKSAPPAGSAALAALMATQPNPPAEKQTVTASDVGKLPGHGADAYVGTSPPNH